MLFNCQHLKTITVSSILQDILFDVNSLHVVFRVVFIWILMACRVYFHQQCELFCADSKLKQICYFMKGVIYWTRGNFRSITEIEIQL